MCERESVRVCVCVHACMCMCVYMRTCLCACMYVCVIMKGFGVSYMSENVWLEVTHPLVSLEHVVFVSGGVLDVGVDERVVWCVFVDVCL